MFSVFVPSESSLKKSTVADLGKLPDNAVWIDLVNPTAVEDRAVERIAGVAIPTREDMQEIEVSSRLYIENGARYMTATLMCQSDTDAPKTTAVTFILAGHRLVTVRYELPKPFALVENKLARSCAPGLRVRYNHSPTGDVAQLGERRVRNAEVVSSILILSTTHLHP